MICFCLSASLLACGQLCQARALRCIRDGWMSEWNGSCQACGGQRKNNGVEGSPWKGMANAEERMDVMTRRVDKGSLGKRTARGHQSGLRISGQLRRRLDFMSHLSPCLCLPPPLLQIRQAFSSPHSPAARPGLCTACPSPLLPSPSTAPKLDGLL